MDPKCARRLFLHSVPREARAAYVLLLALATAVTVVTAGTAVGAGRIPPEVAAAVRGGPVRVIVKLSRPPGTPIDRVQDAVLAELTGTTCRVLHRYRTSPFLALEVGEDALRVLEHSPNVVSVAGDVELRPQTPGVTR